MSSYAYNVTRHPNGAVANFAYGNGITHTGTQTIRNLPDLSSDASFNTTVISDDYNWDANGNVAAILSGAQVFASRSMAYDARDRLTFTSYDKLGPATVNFSYDPLDNLRTYVTPGRNFTHEYDANTWRLTRIRDQFNTTTYQYSYAGDAGNRGNVTTRFQSAAPVNLTHYFTFDQGNRMRALAGSAAQTYTYDGMGRRTRITDSATVYRHQMYSQSGKLVYEREFNPKLKNGQSEKTYAYLDNHLVGRTEATIEGASTKTYIHTDGLGSPVAETNDAGAVIYNSRSLYEPYGLLVPPSPTAQGPGYTGHVRDAATGLNYMQQRYYDPIAGRFLSVDPVSADPNSGGNFNRYWYANNNPYTNIDPDGRQTGSHLDFPGFSGSNVESLQVAAQAAMVQDHVGKEMGAAIRTEVGRRVSVGAEAGYSKGAGMKLSARENLNGDKKFGATAVIGIGKFIAATAEVETFSFALPNYSASPFKIESAELHFGAGLSGGAKIDIDPAGRATLVLSAGFGYGFKGIINKPLNIGVESDDPAK